MSTLPLFISRVGVPPLKCQGIKTKLVPFILSSISWQPGTDGRWIEPFLGSGVVAFNLRPERAVLSDTNAHIIGFYRALQAGEMTCDVVREHLLHEGSELAARGANHYYTVRERFNEQHSPLDLLFLSRSCFNGVMRFNQKGQYNTPFGHKPERFRRAFVTKVVNQVAWCAQQMRDCDWEFRVANWEDTLSLAQSSDFAYLDPPYIGRHTDYYGRWEDEDASRLASTARGLSCGVAASMWLENRYRRNDHVERCWSGFEQIECTHFYHVGASEALRNEMTEVLLIKPGYLVPTQTVFSTRPERSTPHQPALL